MRVQHTPRGLLNQRSFGVASGHIAERVSPLPRIARPTRRRGSHTRSPWAIIATSDLGATCHACSLAARPSVRVIRLRTQGSSIAV